MRTEADELRDIVSRIVAARRSLQEDLCELEGWEDGHHGPDRLRAILAALTAFLDAELDLAGIIGSREETDDPGRAAAGRVRRPR